MKILFLDCGMGVAGDMLSAALLELMPDSDAAIAEMNSFGIPGVEYVRERVSRGGITASHLSVRVHGEEENVHHHHDHDGHDHHGHGHHSHHTLDDILHLVAHLAIPEDVRKNVADVYRLIADAESRAHGRPVGEIHFHEVGALDAVADIAAVCWLISKISPDEIISSPVHVGCGTVVCAHGTMPVPAPATASLLEGVPSYSDGIVQGELCTPTGAALVKHFATRFSQSPLMSTTAIGYGAGKKDFPSRANFVRAFLGDSCTSDAGCDEVHEFICNVDDMTGEEIAFACERLFAAGARDVVTIPITMKKGRPGVQFQVLCAPAERDAVLEAIFRNTTTIGVRETLRRRHILSRTEETISLSVGTNVRVKTSSGHGVVRVKREYDDLARIAIARGESLRDAAMRVEGSISKSKEKTS